jgi:methylenetetrahydrofolate reductase (NADPH)
MEPVERTADRRRARPPEEILANISYEIMPLKGAEDAVLRHVPTEVALTVTATERRGLEATVDLTERLAAQGYRVAPHLAARLIADRRQLAETLARLTASRVDRIFVVGGDARQPLGEFVDANGLLRAIADLGYSFEMVAVGGYPEGHAAISDRVLEQSLNDKAPLATHVITQICFDAELTVDWARRLRARHPGLEVMIGVPAPVSRQKLMRISGGIGLGQSARFLSRHQSLVWRLLQPGGYRPDRLLRGFRTELGRPETNIGGFHLFTFNELERAEAWRQSMLDRNI